jgi:predicted aspartyl protease
MSISFKYEIAGVGAFGLIQRPVATVFFKSPQSDIWTSTLMIVDTGADFTILPRFKAKELAISLTRDCRVEKTAGVGGETKIYILKKKITAKIGDMEREVPLAFFDTDEVPALLGRSGFLETFDIEFLKKKEVVFKD